MLSPCPDAGSNPGPLDCKSEALPFGSCTICQNPDYYFGIAHSNYNTINFILGYSTHRDLWRIARKSSLNFRFRVICEFAVSLGTVSHFNFFICCVIKMLLLSLLRKPWRDMEDCTIRYNDLRMAIFENPHVPSGLSYLIHFVTI